MTLITGGLGGTIGEFILDGLSPNVITIYGADTIIILPMGKPAVKIDNFTYILA
jgi:hypothetical protein